MWIKAKIKRNKWEDITHNSYIIIVSTKWKEINNSTNCHMLLLKNKKKKNISQTMSKLKTKHKLK